VVVEFKSACDCDFWTDDAYATPNESVIEFELLVIEIEIGTWIEIACASCAVLRFLRLFRP